jgi:NAD(P)-dependent dehydrogenase (short-subunit alcohol dehydrogenase family)
MASRTWLITGSSAGFGRELAEAALNAGDKVVATARRPETLDDLVASAPDRVLALALDVTRPEQIEAAVGAALERFGRIDVLVNNAGHGSVGAIEEIDMADLRALMDTMYFGAVALTQAVLPHMREQGSGSIVQLSSMGGQLSTAGFGAYCSAKWALEAMSSALSEEVGPLGIHVLIVEPGQFRTEFGGARMHRSREIDAYAETVGARRPPQSCRCSARPSRLCGWHSATTPWTRSARSTSAGART